MKVFRGLDRRTYYAGVIFGIALGLMVGNSLARAKVPEWGLLLMFFGLAIIGQFAVVGISKTARTIRVLRRAYAHLNRRHASR